MGASNVGLMIHKAMEFVKLGDVLVIDGGGNHSRALLGFIMVKTLAAVNAAGTDHRFLLTSTMYSEGKDWLLIHIDSRKYQNALTVHSQNTKFCSNIR